jgi:hypothetical protein
MLAVGPLDAEKAICRASGDHAASEAARDGGVSARPFAPPTARRATAPQLAEYVV